MAARACALAVFVCAGVAIAQPTRAPGGAPVLRGAETAQRVVAGRIDAAAQIDRHGWRATLAVERDLLAPATGAATAAESLAIGWEELAEGRPPRFAAGDRVLVALEPLPGQSLWRKRFPKRDGFAVAERGTAFLRDPDAATLDTLARLLRVAPAEREESPGVEALAEIVRSASAPVAEGAVARLESVAGLGGKLREPAALALGAALGSEARPDSLRRALLRLAAARRLDGLRAPIADLAARPGPLAGDAWAALATLDGGLPVDTVKRLLDNGDPAVRAVAVRHAAGTSEQPRALVAARSDPSPAVRAAALEASIATGAPEALEVGCAALDDPDPNVRLAAGEALGARGAEVVPRLREVALARSGSRAAGPLGALAFAGPEGQAALLELSHTHPNAETRGLARLLLGLDPKQR